MIFPVMVAVWLAGLALAAAVPVGLAAAREGRLHARSEVGVRAAEAALAEAEAGGWLAGVAGVPVGGRTAIPAAAWGPVVVVREVHRIDAALWLVVARARVAGGGGQLAESTRALLVRIVADSASAGGRVVASARPSFRRPE